MDFKLLFTIVVAGAILIILYKTWDFWQTLFAATLSVLLIVVVLVIRVVHFVLIGWWWLIGSAVVRFLRYNLTALIRPRNSGDAYLWQLAYQYNWWHKAMRTSYGPDWWKDTASGGVFDGRTNLIVSASQRKEIERKEIERKARKEH